MANTSSTRFHYFKIDQSVYFNIILGTTLYLMLSFIRGFIPVAIGYILTLPGVTNEQAALFFILPMTSLFVLPYLVSKFQIMLNSVLVVWFLSIIIKILLIKFILILIGLFLVYSIILNLFTIESASNGTALSIFIMILLDLGLKGVNRGNDPLSYYNIFSAVFSLTVVIILLLLIRENKESLNMKPIERIAGSSNSNRIKDSSTYAFFLGLLMYFLWYSNPGIISLSQNEAGQFIITIFILLSSSIAYIALQVNGIILHDQKYFVTSLLLIPISTFLVPWTGFTWIFGLIGLFSTIFLLNYNLLNMANHLSITTSSIYFFTLMSFLVFLFLIISKDGLVIPIVVSVLATVFTLFSYMTRTKIGGVIA